MLRGTVIAFILGFLSYGAVPLAMDLTYTSESTAEPLWGVEFSVLWGGIGGITFVVSWLCIVGLWHIAKKLMIEKDT
jgi:hypothetical protein